MLDEIRELYDYNRWANGRVLDAVTRLPAEALTREIGGSFPTLLATLAHMAGAEWLWLRRWRGSSPPAMPGEWADLTLDRLRDEWREVASDQEAFLRDLTEDDLRTVLAYRTLNGTAMSNPLWQVLRHVVNHATYHRGQVTTLIRQLGGQAVSTDLVLYYREGPGAA